MKRIAIAVAALLTTVGAWAEGYQINTLSAKQLGMGHTGTALKLGSESMIFNPGALGFSDKTIDLSCSVTGIKAIATAEHNGQEYKTENGLSTPLAVSASFKIYNNLQAGVAFYTPYGSAINWTNDWPGAILNQKVDLKTYTIQPTISWRITPKLSVGVGMMLTWGSVNLDKALLSGQQFDALAGMLGLPMTLGHAPAASVNLTGTSQVAVGANIGAMYDITDKWTVGANFRTKMGMKVTAGIAKVSYASDKVQGVLDQILGDKNLGLINESNFKASMPCPYVLNFGVSYKPLSNLVIAAEAQLTGWKTYEQLDILFPDYLSGFNQNIPKHYKNAWAYHLGAQYGLTERFDIRAGLMVDTTPVNSNFYNPETPGMTKIEPTVGFSFRPIRNLSIDLAFMYIAGLGEDNAKCTYKNSLTGAEDTFEANYKVHAFAPSVGLSYSF
ncbi:MAG: outer membrane protein transport protein [Firmicutes bacterium]|nr:outer membrane protein transport protein [Bacillota bacterium]MCM1401633.1 outer membrane protein transport protein [Bacteroides sp.]MCM1477519.1 outer membrane protein transport protein [Bacteroides sp.]